MLSYNITPQNTHLMKAVILFCSLVVSLLLTPLALSEASPPEKDARLTILSSIRPLDLLVEELVGDLVEHDVLLEGHQSPHHLVLKMSHMKKLNEADLLLWVGPEMEQYLVKPAASSASELAMSKIPGVFWLENAERLKQQSSEHSHAAERDPHIWLDLKNVESLAVALVARLNGLMPAQHLLLQDRLQAFLKKLADMHRLLALELNSQVGFAAYHEGYAYFVNAYSLKQDAALVKNPTQKLSVKRRAELKNTLKNSVCLIADTSEMQAAQRYANLFQLELVEVDLLASSSVSKTFSEYYLNIGKAFKACMARDKVQA